MGIKNRFNHSSDESSGSSWKKDWEIIKEFTIQDFKLKYKNSVIGYLWSLLNPLLMLVTLYFVFSFIMKLSVPYYQLFLLLGIILWNFISDATNASIDSLNSKGHLLRKIKFPPYTIVISACIVSAISLILNLLVFFIFMAIFKVKIGFAALLFPVYLIELMIFVLGISFVLCGVYVKLRDMKHIWNFLLLILFWISPSVYPENRIPIQYMRFYMLNPLSRLINGSRDSLIYSYLPEAKQIIITSIVCFAVLLIGIKIFEKMTQKIAEEI
jgi:lipopolysaccharide transport system permease protein